MPEGDTIHRVAARLHRALAGGSVVAFDSVLPALMRVHHDTPITGRWIERIAAAGKHVLMHLSASPQPDARGPALVLRTHMRMNGSWHLYRRGERWQRARRDMRVMLATDEFEAVAFRVPIAEFVRAADLQRHDDLRRLGPDLLADDFDPRAAVGRLRARGNTAIGEALLNQRLLAGIGNVYKSEVLFACRVNPFSAVAELEDPQLEALVETARRLLRANLTAVLPAMTTYAGYRRTTGRDDPTQRLWVYGRAGRPCRRCGSLVRRRKTGDDARLTYWCPRCQA